MFAEFTKVAPIGEASLVRFGPLVPSEVVDVWRKHGTGFVGDGYFRLVDPGRAQAMLGQASPLPEDAVILFTTAMADLIGWWHGMFLVAKTRLGEIHATSEPFDTLVALMADLPGQRDIVWDWQPYPAAQTRLGVPSFEDCFMHIPLLLVGGRPDPDQMQTGGLWPHIMLMTAMTGPPKFTHMLPLPTSQ